jgi:hypothetical protein
MAWAAEILNNPINNPITEDDVNKRRSDVTGALSVQFRALSVGLLAVCGALLLGETKSFEVPEWAKTRLAGVALGVIVAIAMDLIQYVFAYAHAARADSDLKTAVSAATKSGKPCEGVDWDNRCWQYRSQMTFFWGKLLLLGVLTTWMCWFMTLALLNPSKKAEIKESPPTVNVFTK